MPLKRVVQKDATGCGLACIAMVAGVSYTQAKKAAVKSRVVDENQPYYTNSGQLARILEELGGSAEKGRRLSHWSSLTSLCIVGIGYKEAEDTWHWVVFVPDRTGGHVLDPRKSVTTNRRKDFSRMVPHRYIPVTRPAHAL